MPVYLSPLLFLLCANISHSLLLSSFIYMSYLLSVSIGNPNGGHHHHDHDHDHDHGHGHGHGEHDGHGDGDGEDCKDEVVLGDLIKELGIKVRIRVSDPA